MRELASWLHSELQVTRRPPGPGPQPENCRRARGLSGVAHAPRRAVRRSGRAAPSVTGRAHLGVVCPGAWAARSQGACPGQLVACLGPFASLVLGCGWLSPRGRRAAPSCWPWFLPKLGGTSLAAGGSVLAGARELLGQAEAGAWPGAWVAEERALPGSARPRMVTGVWVPGRALWPRCFGLISDPCGVKFSRLMLPQVSPPAPASCIPLCFRDEETGTQRGSSWATSAWQPTGRAAGARSRRTPGPAEWKGGAGGFRPPALAETPRDPLPALPSRPGYRGARQATAQEAGPWRRRGRAPHRGQRGALHVEFWLRSCRLWGFVMAPRETAPPVSAAGMPAAPHLAQVNFLLPWVKA